VHDIDFFESRGLPSAFVASCEFEDGAQAQARSLGTDPVGVFVPHPIQDRTDDEMVAIADAAARAVVAGLTSSS
jgi:hypothetical protein